MKAQCGRILGKGSYPVWECPEDLTTDVDSPLYAVSMFYYHWLIKKLLRPMAGQNRTRQENQTKIQRVGRAKETPCS